MRAELEPGDRLVLSTDLVKPEAVLVRAYDDRAGVTAAFDKNLLARINRELGANFDLARWTHRAVWNAAESRVEMHLVSLVTQTVRIPAAELLVRYIAGETVWTESSHKHAAPEVRSLAGRTGYRCEEQWIDGERAFAQSLFVAD